MRKKRDSVTLGQADNDSKKLEHLYISSWFPLTTFSPSADLMCLQVLLRVSISFENHKVNNFVRDEIPIVIDGKIYIIF